MATSAEDLAPIELHGRTYQLPRRPTVVVCVDGFDPEYLQIGCADGILPNLSKFVRNGFHATANVPLSQAFPPPSTELQETFTLIRRLAKSI